jgi:hypothetical protein
MSPRRPTERENLAGVVQRLIQREKQIEQLTALIERLSKKYNERIDTSEYLVSRRYIYL